MVPLRSKTPRKKTKEAPTADFMSILTFQHPKSGPFYISHPLIQVCNKNWQVSCNNRKRYSCGAVYEDSGPNLASPQSHICGLLDLYQYIYSDPHLPETRV